MRSCFSVATILLLALFCGVAEADQIKLTDGTVIYGKVQDTFNPDVITVETPSGPIPVSKDKILYIRKDAREVREVREVRETIVRRAEPPSLIGAERWYLGADIGSSTANGFCDGLGPNVFCGDTATGFRLDAGYQVNQFFAVEGAYADNGTLNLSTSGFSGEAKFTEVQVAAVGTIPFTSSFAGILKGGVTFWNLNASGSIFVVPPPSENGADLLLGIGGRYDFTNRLALRFTFEGRNAGHFNSPITGGTVSLNSFYLGFIYKI